MEREILVFSRNGSLRRLKKLLGHKRKKDVELLVSSPVNGATPLIMASLNGHSRVVLYLIKKCHANGSRGRVAFEEDSLKTLFTGSSFSFLHFLLPDTHSPLYHYIPNLHPNKVGSVTFNGKTIEGATALWCAAAVGHVYLVKILVKYKANVNHQTKDKYTPLLAACFNGHFEIAKYLIEHGANIEIATKNNYTPLIVSSYNGNYEFIKYLIECGADVNKKTLKGHTALHGSAKSRSLDIIKLLMENGAKLSRNSYGTTPFLTAAIAGDADIVHYFVQVYSFTHCEKINGLELLGATYMYKEGFLGVGLKFWLQAMELRDEDNLCDKLTVQSPIASYIGATEVRTISQLEDIKSDPVQMRKQALLVKERILGPGHPDVHACIRHWCSLYFDSEHFDTCVQLSMYALDVQQRNPDPLSYNTYYYLLKLVEVFSYKMSNRNWLFVQRHPSVAVCDILKIFERVLKEIETALQVSQQHWKYLNYTNNLHRIFVIAMHLIVLMCQLQPHLDEKEELLLKASVHRFVQMNPRSQNGWTPLHLACHKHTSTLVKHSVCSFPSSEVVDLLLEVGASPNALDLQNNTPLRIIAMNESCDIAVFLSLLKHGAHLDMCNLEKQTPFHLAQNTLDMIIFSPLQYIRLQCLCAKVIKSNEIPYKGIVHKILEEFIDVH